MKGFCAGDYILFQSQFETGRVWYGQIVGFCYKGEIAICTDGTGLPPRPVKSKRLFRDPQGPSRYTLAAVRSPAE